MHSAQGITIGRGHALERCLLVWNKQMEAKWPGIFYVAASRVKELAAFALKEPFSAEDARSIGVGTVAKESRREMALIQHNADKHSRTRDPGRTFAAGLRWFCGRVKAQVAARLAGEPGLSDVVEVCQAWEDGLVAS